MVSMPCSAVRSELWCFAAQPARAVSLRCAWRQLPGGDTIAVLMMCGRCGSVQIWFAGRPGRLLVHWCSHVMGRQSWQAAAEMVQARLPQVCTPAALCMLPCQHVFSHTHSITRRGRFFHQKHVSSLGHSLDVTSCAQVCC